MAAMPTASALCVALLLLPGLYALPPTLHAHQGGQLLGDAEGRQGRHVLAGAGGARNGTRSPRLALYYVAGGRPMVTAMMVMYEKKLKFEKYEIPHKRVWDPRGTSIADLDKMTAEQLAHVRAVVPFADNRAVGLLNGHTPQPVLVDRKMNETMQGTHAIAKYLDKVFPGVDLAYHAKNDTYFGASELTLVAELASIATRRAAACIDAATGVESGVVNATLCSKEVAAMLLDDVQQRLVHIEQLLPEYEALYKDRFTFTDATLLPFLVNTQFWGADFQGKGYKNIAAYLDKMRDRPNVVAALTHFPIFKGIPKPQKDIFKDLAPFEGGR